MSKQPKIYIIAEIGQNHQGNLFFAKQMVDVLSNTPKINAIKAVKRDLETCLTQEQKRQPYLNRHSFGENYLQHRQALELSKDDFLELKNYVESKGLDFIASFTDIPSLHFLVDIGVQRLKIPSQRVPDIRLIKETAKTKLPVILSTGMSDIYMINQAVNLLKDLDLWIMQCSSIYPTPDNLMNLSVIPEYKKRYNRRIGLSSHNQYLLADAIAYLLGATVFEHHFTLSQDLRGRDHMCSFTTEDFRNLSYILSAVNTLLGSPIKQILKEETEAIARLRTDINEIQL